MTIVVDENVLIIANDLTRRSLGLEPLCPDANEDCGISCAEALLSLIENGRVGLDDGSEVLDKYKSHCSFSGQPGVGDTFLRAVFERGYVESWAERVIIRENGAIRLPNSFLNCGFDNDDHVWVAIAHNSSEKAKILNAADSDYRIHAGDLSVLNLEIVELCSQSAAEVTPV